MRKKGISNLVIVALVLVLLAALNPTMADFKANQARAASAKAGGELGGSVIGQVRKGVGSVAGGVASLFAGAYGRKDYILFSTFQAGDSGPLYLGVAKLFVKLR